MMKPKIITESKIKAMFLLMLDISSINKLISIGDNDNPVFVKKHPDYLRLDFPDYDYGSIGPQIEDIEQICAYIQKAKDEQYSGTFLIHCHAGISRSSAAAFIAHCMFDGPGKEQESLSSVYLENPYARPNILMIEYADKHLERCGKMNSALGERRRGPLSD